MIFASRRRRLAHVKKAGWNVASLNAQSPLVRPQCFSLFVRILEGRRRDSFDIVAFALLWHGGDEKIGLGISLLLSFLPLGTRSAECGHKRRKEGIYRGQAFAEKWIFCRGQYCPANGEKGLFLVGVRTYFQEINERTSQSLKTPLFSVSSRGFRKNQ